MTISDADLVDAISNLNNKTRRKDLIWSPLRRSADPENSELSYTTPHPGFPERTLRITRYEHQRARIPYVHPRGPQTPSRYKLEIVDEQDRPIYVFPEVQGIADLFDSVTAQFGNVEDLIKSLLSNR
jgi:hypothetical protein